MTAVEHSPGQQRDLVQKADEKASTQTAFEWILHMPEAVGCSPRHRVRVHWGPVPALCLPRSSSSLSGSALLPCGQQPSSLRPRDALGSCDQDIRVTTSQDPWEESGTMKAQELLQVPTRKQNPDVSLILLPAFVLFRNSGGKSMACALQRAACYHRKL